MTELNTITGVLDNPVRPFYPRPVIFDYDSIPGYLAAMLSWLKLVEPQFSIRRETRHFNRCSPALVTQVVRGRRKLTPEKVELFSKLLRLTHAEKNYLFSWIELEEGKLAAETPRKPVRRQRSAQNHILSDWLNPYVKDSARLRGFKADPKVVHRMLGGMASVKKIQRSLDFLLREGFLRKTLDGRVVENEVLVTTTDEVPNEKIRAFHRHALEVAKRSLALYPIEMRQASTLVLPLNEASRQELKQMLKDFYQKLLDFAEEHQSDSEQLYQIVLNLSPIGGTVHDP